MRRTLTRHFIFALLISAILLTPAPAQQLKGHSSAAPPRLTLPMKDGSTRFAVIGDTGSGTKQQREVGDMMIRYHALFPFEFVLMMGDNMYGGEAPQDFEKKFAQPYRALLDTKVKFYATLGNHDQALQVNYVNFNMNGKEYYRFKKGNIAFYSLNSNYMDKKQVQWLEDELGRETAEWKVMFFHHPPYSSAKKHGSDGQLREVVEPIFLKYGVDVVLTGHDHVYERMKPQKGIYYFVSGAGGKLRTGDIDRQSGITEKSYDRDLHFMLFEVAGDQMYFQAISRTGETIDSGVIARK
ncbi:MAG TPA: metallophosphoesterase [Pyrinomonadaceae bacterium]|jgi:predicted phosphodiesterase|nr:metallophosphoesterase [Pyrinomonadaceae bacterium]